MNPNTQFERLDLETTFFNDLTFQEKSRWVIKTCQEYLSGQEFSKEKLINLLEEVNLNIKTFDRFLGAEIQKGESELNANTIEGYIKKLLELQDQIYEELEIIKSGFCREEILEKLDLGTYDTEE